MAAELTGGNFVADLAVREDCVAFIPKNRLLAGLQFESGGLEEAHSVDIPFDIGGDLTMLL